MSADVVMIPGEGSLPEPGGGHSRYVVARARAARRAGYRPHLVCAAPTSGMRASRGVWTFPLAVAGDPGGGASG